jgi:hypothetical protein
MDISSPVVRIGVESAATTDISARPMYVKLVSNRLYTISKPFTPAFLEHDKLAKACKQGKRKRV